jgi:hypothetical protein
VDNVVRYGRVSDPDYTDDKVEGVRSLLNHLSADDEVEATTMAMVDAKASLHVCPQSDEAERPSRDMMASPISLNFKSVWR